MPARKRVGRISGEGSLFSATSYTMHVATDETGFVLASVVTAGNASDLERASGLVEQARARDRCRRGITQRSGSDNSPPAGSRGRLARKRPIFQSSRLNTG